MYPFLFENIDFFPPVWPTVHRYSVKMVTKNASLQRRSAECRILKMLVTQLRVDR